MSKLLGDRRDRNKYLLSSYCMSDMRHCSATNHQSGSVKGSKTKQNHLSSLKKSCISYQFRPDLQTHGHRPQYTADNDAAEIDMSAQICQVAAASTIREMRSSSESTSHRHLQRSLDWTGRA